LDNCAIRKFIIWISVDGHGVGNENGPGGRSKTFAAAETDGKVDGGGGGKDGAVDGKLVGLDSVAEGDGERPFDDGQCGDIRCCCWATWRKYCASKRVDSKRRNWGNKYWSSSSDEGMIKLKFDDELLKFYKKQFTLI